MEPLQPTAEGTSVDVVSTFVDPGILDTHTAQIDWGDGTVDSGIVADRGGRGEVTGSHIYGDDGVYDVTIEVTDNDGGTSEDTATVQLTNLAPTVSLDTSNTIVLPTEEDVFLGVAKREQSHGLDAVDPGSDDLTVRWMTGEMRVYFNNGVREDPDPSSVGTFPFEVTDTAHVTFVEPGVREVGVTVTDDDGDRAEMRLSKLVTGDAETTKSLRFWRRQYGANGDARYSTAELEGFLEIATFGSSVFSERTDSSTVDAAHAVLSPTGSTTREKAEAQALAVWLNFAAGGVGWDEQIDINGDGSGDRAFHEVNDEIEDILTSPNASEADLEHVTGLSEAINAERGDRFFPTLPPGFASPVVLVLVAILVVVGFWAMLSVVGRWWRR